MVNVILEEKKLHISVAYDYHVDASFRQPIPKKSLTLDARDFRSQAVQIRSPFNDILNSSCYALNLHPFRLRSPELLHIVWCLVESVATVLIE